MKVNNDLLEKEWQAFLRKAKKGIVTKNKYFRIPKKFQLYAKEKGFDVNKIIHTTEEPAKRTEVKETKSRAFKKAEKHRQKKRKQEVPQAKGFRSTTKAQKHKVQSKTWSTRTPALNKLTEETKPLEEEQKQEWSEEMQKQKDEEEVKQIKTKRKSPIKDEDLALANILDILDSIRVKHPQSADWFEEILQQQIDAYGVTSVAESISKLDREKLEELVFVAFYDEGEWHSKAMSMLLIALKGGEIPTAEELQKLQEQIDSNENGEGYSLDTLADNLGMNIPM